MKTAITKVLLGALVTVLCFGIFYLLTSFNELSFDVRKWNALSRSFVACMGGFVSIVVGVMVVGFYKTPAQ